MSWLTLIGLVYWLRTFSSYDTEGGKVSKKEGGGLAKGSCQLMMIMMTKIMK
jgi:hypothetical protein